jgi:hypothetical protein
VCQHRVQYTQLYRYTDKNPYWDTDENPNRNRHEDAYRNWDRHGYRDWYAYTDAHAVSCRRRALCIQHPLPNSLQHPHPLSTWLYGMVLP